MSEIYQKGLEQSEMRDSVAGLSESTALRLANTVHTSRVSQQLMQVRKYKYVSRIFDQLIELGLEKVEYLNY